MDGKNFIQADADEAASLSFSGLDSNTGNLEGLSRANSVDSDTYFFVMFNSFLRIGDGENSYPTFK